MTTKIEISSYSSSTQHAECRISKKLRKELQLPNDLKQLKIRCSMHSVTCNVVFINEDRLTLSVTDEALQLLRLPIPITLQGKINKKNELILGPVIAVLTEEKTKQDHLFGPTDQFYKELAQYCVQNGFLFYIFSIPLYDDKKMHGYVLKQNNWEKYAVPYPQVVHNRLHSRSKERSDDFSKVAADLTNKKVPYFNDRFLNKWEVHRILSANEHLIPYLPYTELLTSKMQFERMVLATDDLFIKPINGSQGRRIFRVTHNHGKFSLDYTTFSGKLETEFLSLQKLYTALYPRLKREKFLLQETIQLQTYNNRPLDFRFLCHKKRFHKWKVTSAVARVSARNEFVANLARGGELLGIKQVLQQLYGEKKSQHIRKLLGELSIEIANAICLHVDGEFGEFGIDLALDSKGHPWIIEVNTKPSKKTGDTEWKVRPSAKAIINYCLSLYEMNKKQ
ncbi:YheC/YheD family protein [Metabacillus fastidiosus]|uniref:YheC/YheD family endospore coat-associated protein n=1 Tax=Metabacillus fastidiosus TaxID=1458 RepID=UPI003D2DCE0F